MTRLEVSNLLTFIASIVFLMAVLNMTNWQDEFLNGLVFGASVVIILWEILAMRGDTA